MRKIKQKKCFKCGVKLHRTDWEILKYHNTFPICDECDLKYSNVVITKDSRHQLTK